jgi:hypothetical protein
MLPTDLPRALIALGVTLAIIFAINRFGFMRGKTGPATASAGSAQVAAVIAIALNHAHCRCGGPDDGRHRKQCHCAPARHGD